MMRNGIKTKSSPDRILRRKEAAERFAVCPKTLDNWKNRGILMPVTIPGTSRAIGYRESDINALIAGNPSSSDE